MDYITWIVTTTDPRWLQALSGIIALVLSVWSIHKQGSTERKRDELQKQGIAVSIYIELLKLSGVIAEIQAKLHKLEGTWEPAMVQIPIPPMIDRNIDRLYMLGKSAGPSCLQLVATMFQYNTMVDQMFAADARATVRLADHLLEIDLIIQRCEEQVKPIHDILQA